MTIRSAKARWDTKTDPSNPGWVVDVVTLAGRVDYYAPAPSVYHLGPGAENAARVVTETLWWEGLKMQD